MMTFVPSQRRFMKPGNVTEQVHHQCHAETAETQYRLTPKQNLKYTCILLIIVSDSEVQSALLFDGRSEQC